METFSQSLFSIGNVLIRFNKNIKHWEEGGGTPPQAMEVKVIPLHNACKSNSMNGPFSHLVGRGNRFE